MIARFGILNKAVETQEEQVEEDLGDGGEEDGDDLCG